MWLRSLCPKDHQSNVARCFRLIRGIALWSFASYIESAAATTFRTALHWAHRNRGRSGDGKSGHSTYTRPSERPTTPLTSGVVLIMTHNPVIAENLNKTNRFQWGCSVLVSFSRLLWLPHQSRRKTVTEFHPNSWLLGCRMRLSYIWNKFGALFTAPLQLTALRTRTPTWLVRVLTHRCVNSNINFMSVSVRTWWTRGTYTNRVPVGCDIVTMSRGSLCNCNKMIENGWFDIFWRFMSEIERRAPGNMYTIQICLKLFVSSTKSLGQSYSFKSIRHTTSRLHISAKPYTHLELA